MDKMNNYSEQIKTGLIVALLLITVLLLSFLWGGNIDAATLFQKETNLVENTEQDVDIYRFFKPFQARINFGGENYTIVYGDMDNVWNVFLTACFPQNSNETRYIEEISKEKWDEILTYESIEFDLGFEIPFDEINTLYNTGKSIQSNVIKKISSCAYSELAPKDFFVYDDENKKYYRIITEKEHVEILDEIDKIEEKFYDRYNPIKSYFGVGDNTLMPYSLKSSIYSIESEQEIQYYEEDKITDLAELFFKESFDFVRKIVETEGTVIYMYGYGTKSLLVGNNGQIKYEEDVTSDNKKTVGYIDALKIAVHFINSHGDWKTLKGKDIYPYLKFIHETDKGYKISFGYRINGYPICYEQGEALELEVVDGQVTYYKRYILNQKDTVTVIKNDGEVNQNIIPAHITITNNYDRLKAIYIENGYDFNKMEDENIFNQIINAIQDVKIAYFLKASDNNSKMEFIPAWVFVSDAFRIYFSIESGEYLGWNKI